MPAFKRDLSNVQELLTKGRFDQARQECSQALKEGWGSTYDAHVYARFLATCLRQSAFRRCHIFAEDHHYSLRDFLK